MVEFADDLALDNISADADWRGNDAAGDGRRDVGTFIGDEGASLFEIGGGGAIEGAGGIEADRFHFGGQS